MFTVTIQRKDTIVSQDSDEKGIVVHIPLESIRFTDVEKNYRFHNCRESITYDFLCDLIAALENKLDEFVFEIESGDTTVSPPKCDSKQAKSTVRCLATNIRSNPPYKGRSMWG